MRDFIVFAIVIGGLPFAFTRPFVGLLIFSWLAYMRPQDLCWGFARYMAFSQYTAIAMLSGWVFFEKRPFFRPAPPVKWIFLLFTWITVSMFLNEMSSAPKQIARWMDLAKVLIIALFTIGQIDTKYRLQLFLWVVALSLGFFGVKGGAWGLLTGGRINQGPGGMLKDNNDLCLALNMNLPILYYLGKSNKRLLIRRGMWVAMLLTGVAVIITGSRGGMLTMAAVTGMLVLKSRYRVIGICTGMVLLVLVLLFLPKDIRERYSTLKDPAKESSAASRLYAWSVALRMIRGNPLLGVGYSNFLANFRRYEIRRMDRPRGENSDINVAHNSYLQVWAESGTPSFLFFLSMIFSTVLLMRRMRRHVRTRAGPYWFECYTHMIEVSMFAFLVGGTFLNRAHFDLLYHLVAVGCVMLVLLPKVMKDHEEERQRRVSGEAVETSGIELIPSPTFALVANP